MTVRVARAPRAHAAARAALLVGGLAASMTLRLAVAATGRDGDVAAGLCFAVALTGLALCAGWRPGRARPAALVAGVLGAAALLAVPVALRLAGAPEPGRPPLAAFATWSVVVTAVAVAEELLLRGALFDAVGAAAGPAAAVAVTATLFAALHVPLYGWGALPLDAAVGVWLGGLRIATGGVAAPAMAHALADLAAWWLR